jgi:hypothetical protein
MVKKTVKGVRLWITIALYILEVSYCIPPQEIMMIHHSEIMDSLILKGR